MYTVEPNKIRRLREIDSKPYTLERYEDLILAPHAAYRGVYDEEKQNSILNAVIELYNISYRSKDLSCYSAISKAYQGCLEDVPKLLIENPMPLHLAVDYLCLKDERLKRLSVNHLSKEHLDWAHEKALQHIKRHLNALYHIKAKN